MNAVTGITKSNRGRTIAITYADGRTVSAANELSNGCIHDVHRMCRVRSGSWRCGGSCHA